MCNKRDNGRVRVIYPQEGMIVLVDEIYCDKCGGVIDPELIPSGYVLQSKLDPDNPDLCIECLNEEIKKVMMES